MPTYDKKLKRSPKDGCLIRYIGKNSKDVSEKFRLGFDLREAERREALIRELWAHQEANADYTLGDFHWSPSYLKAAKAIAKGKQPVLPPTFKVKSDPAKYVEALNQIGDEFHPADEALYEAGITQISQEIRGRNGVLSARDNVARTGQTVADAIAAFRDHLHTAAIKSGDDEALTSWQLASFAPHRLAAIAPICGGGEVYWTRSFAHLPVWAFHGGKDTGVPLERSQEMVDALRKKGGDPKLTVYPEAGHDSWTETYNNPALYEWLLEQRRVKKE